MSKNDEIRLESLSKQYKNIIIRIKSNEEVLKIREKKLAFFLIVGIFSWCAIIVGTINIIQNIIIRNIVAIIAIASNLYVYGLFMGYYKEEILKENEELLKTLDDLSREIDVILKNNNINEQIFYNNLINKYL